VLASVGGDFKGKELLLSPKDQNLSVGESFLCISLSYEKRLGG
jgi:hypothetical protein